MKYLARLPRVSWCKTNPLWSAGAITEVCCLQYSFQIQKYSLFSFCMLIKINNNKQQSLSYSNNALLQGVDKIEQGIHTYQFITFSITFYFLLVLKICFVYKKINKENCLTFWWKRKPLTCGCKVFGYGDELFCFITALSTRVLCGHPH